MPPQAAPQAARQTAPLAERDSHGINPAPQTGAQDKPAKPKAPPVNSPKEPPAPTPQTQAEQARAQANPEIAAAAPGTAPTPADQPQKDADIAQALARRNRLAPTGLAGLSPGKRLKIAHLADIHIVDARRPEYAAVFDSLRASLAAETPDLIVVAGDIFDTPKAVSANERQDVSNFLIMLSAQAPVVLIPGNHDTVVKTPGALCSLTNLLEHHAILKPPLLTYLRDSGVYAAHGIIWSVIATDRDPQQPLPSPEQEEAAAAEHNLEQAPRICLFHEEINGTRLPNGTELREYRLATTSFARYDLALGGHIHLQQVFGAGRAAYCGSLVQQTFGESHNGHGYLLWELTRRAEPGGRHRTAQPAVRRINIINGHGGFQQIDVNAAGEDVTVRPLLERPQSWALVHEADAAGAAADAHSKVEAIAREYEAKYKKRPHRVQPKAGPAGRAGPAPAAAAGQAEAEAVRTECLEWAAAQAAAHALDAHFGFIRDRIAEGPVREAVLRLHEERFHNTGCAKTGGCFRITRFEFSNLFAFGPNNVVDFTALEGGVSGIVAANAAGKSSLINALMFALYEVHPAAQKKVVVNHRATSCWLMLKFELDGKTGCIIKEFETRGHQRESKYYFEYDSVNCSGSGVSDTLKNIRGLLGSADTALASSFQLQRGETVGFIDATVTERQALLVELLSLGSFEDLRTKISKEKSTASGLAKAYFRPVALGNAKETCRNHLRAELANAKKGFEDDTAKATPQEAEEREAQAEAQRAAYAAGEAAAQAASAKAALATANQALKGVGGAPPSAKCAEQIERWEAIVGETHPAEHADPVVRVADTWIGGEVGQAHLAALEKAEAEAAAEMAAAEQAALIAQATLAATPKPAPERPETARKRPAPAGTARGRDRPQPPGFPRPRAGPTEGPVRGGDRPTPAECEAAEATVAGCSAEEAAASAAEAEGWNAAEYGSLGAECAEPEEGRPAATAPECAEALEAAERERAVARQELAGLGPTAEAAAKSHPDAEAPGTLAECEAAAQDARSWAAGAAYASAASRRLQPRSGCAGCAHAKKLLADYASGDAEKALAEAERALEGARAKAYRVAAERLGAAEAKAQAAAANHEEAQRKERRAAARARRAQLERAREAAERHAARAEALDVRGRERFWAARDAEAWQAHDQIVIAWEANEAEHRERHRAEAAAELEAAKRERAEAQAARAAERRRASLEIAAAEAAARYEAARAKADSSAETHRRRRSARGDALGGLAWWRRAQGAASRYAEAAKASEAETEAADAAKASRAKSNKAAEAAEAAKQHLAGTKASAAKHESNAKLYELQLKEEQERLDKSEAAAQNLEILEAYENILKPHTGIGDQLLERARPLLNRQLNAGLRELGAAFEAELTEKYELVHRAGEGEEWIPTALASGYQKFVLGLAARLAFWRLASTARPDAIVVDEGFGACDEENLAKIAEALVALAAIPGGPRLVFLVSHVDTLKARLRNALEISVSEARESDGKISRTSRVANAEALPKAARVERAEPAEPEGAAKPARKARKAKPEEPAEPEAGKEDAEAKPARARAKAKAEGEEKKTAETHYHCTTCDKYLSKGCAARHPSTKAHQKMLEKKESA